MQKYPYVKSEMIAIFDEIRKQIPENFLSEGIIPNYSRESLKQMQRVIKEKYQFKNETKKDLRVLMQDITLIAFSIYYGDVLVMLMPEAKWVYGMTPDDTYIKANNISIRPFHSIVQYAAGMKGDLFDPLRILM